MAETEVLVDDVDTRKLALLGLAKVIYRVFEGEACGAIFDAQWVEDGQLSRLVVTFEGGVRIDVVIDLPSSDHPGLNVLGAQIYRMTWRLWVRRETLVGSFFRSMRRPVLLCDCGVGEVLVNF